MTQNGFIHIIGIGPGSPDLIAPLAQRALEEADVLLGYRTYLDLLQPLALKGRLEPSGMGQEVPRANRAVDLAQNGECVALVSDGDAGIYGMAGLLYEVAAERQAQVGMQVIPGISALNAAAALLGAPLSNDFAVISLSDYLTPLEDILRRVELAAQAGFVLCIYNPQGRQRRQPFQQACRILLDALPPQTPVGIVHSAYRPQQITQVLSLVELPQAEVDMRTLIIVGSRATEIIGGKMVSRRGYGKKYRLVE